MRERTCPKCRRRLPSPELMPNGVMPIGRGAPKPSNGPAPPAAPAAPPAASPPAGPATPGAPSSGLASPEPSPGAVPPAAGRQGPPKLGQFSSATSLPLPGEEPGIGGGDQVSKRTLVWIIAGTLVVFVAGLLVLDSLGGDGGDDGGEGPELAEPTVEPSIPFHTPELPEDADEFTEPPVVPPEDWDPLVADLVPFVEEARRLRFQEPVKVELIPGAELVAEFQVPEDPILVEYLDVVVAAYRALGLLEGDVDVLAQMRQGTDIGLMGYYDPLTDVIRVRDDVGGEAGRSPFQRAVLVHELTHALQDQHADLSEQTSSIDKVAMQRMMIEGDARRIERAYVESLPAEEQAQYHDTIGSAEASAAEAGLLPVLGIEGYVAYEGGSQITRLVNVLDGSEAVTLLLRYPPDRPAQLLRASTLFLHGQEPWASSGPEADFPEVPRDALGWDQYSLGAWMWYVTFAVRMDPADALRAADAIGSDAYTWYETFDGQICSAHELVAAGPGEMGHLAVGLRRWADALPHGADIDFDDTVAHVTVCDPGPAASAAFTSSPAGIVDGPIARVGAVADVLEPQRGWWYEEELKEEDRWCLAETVQEAISLDEALEGLSTERIAALGEWAVRSCLQDRLPGGPGMPEGECSAEGMEAGGEQEGLPPEVAATRRSIIEAAISCDYDALKELFASSAPLFDDGAAPPGNSGRELVDRWRRRESAGQRVLANLARSLDSGWFCGPDVAATIEGREGGSACAWVWSGPGPVPNAAYVVIIGRKGGWLGFGEHVEIQSELMDLWADLMTRERSAEPFSWLGAHDRLPEGWPLAIAPGVQLSQD